MKSTSFYLPMFISMTILLHVSCDDEDDLERSVAVNFDIGEISASGGMVFHDKGEYIDGWRYIEVAPEDIIGDIEWGCFNTPITEARNLGIGMGKSNTEAIVVFHDALDDYYTNPSICSAESNGTVAAKMVSELTVASYNDWHLPSEDETKLMYENLHLNGLGNFSEDHLYWSSTEHDDNTATTMDFANGDQGWLCKQCSFGITRIRAIRYF